MKTNQPYKKPKKDIKKIIEANEKLVDEYWNKRTTWSKAEILDLIRNNLTIDEIV